MKQINFKFPYHRQDYIIHTDVEDMERCLYFYYGCSFIEKPSDDAYKITVKADSGGVRVSFGETDILVKDPLPAISEAIFGSKKLDANLFGLHAACIVKNEKAYAFVAPTSAGKSTLTAYLINNGCDYITDDCTIINQASFYVQPFGNPIHLRDGGMAILESKGIQPEVLYIGNRYVYKPNNLITKPVELGGIFIISRSEMINKFFIPSQSLCIELLMKSPVISYGLSYEYIKFLLCLSKMNVVELIYKDLEYVLEILSQRVAI